MILRGWGVLVTDRQTDICDFRVASMTENNNRVPVQRIPILKVANVCSWILIIMYMRLQFWSTGHFKPSRYWKRLFRVKIGTILFFVFHSSNIPGKLGSCWWLQYQIKTQVTDQEAFLSRANLDLLKFQLHYHYPWAMSYHISEKQVCGWMENLQFNWSNFCGYFRAPFP